MGRARWLLGGGLVALAACSFTTASGFDECTTDVQCGAGMACTQSTCLPLPDGCRRHAGAFDKVDRVPIVALQPITVALEDGGSGIDESEAQALNAMTLALEEANKFDGLKGRLFGLFSCDTHDDNDRGATQAGWMVKNVGTPALLTSGSGLTQNVANQPERLAAKAFVISPTATSASLIPLFRSDGNVWRVAPDDTQQAVVMADEVAQATAGNPNLKVVIAHETSVYGSAFEPALRDELARRGRIPVSKPFDRGLDRSQTVALVNGIANESPVATVLIAFPPDVVSIVSEASANAKLRRANGHHWFLADAAKDPNIVTPATATELETSVGTAPAQGAGAAFGSFSDAFSTRFGVRPDTFSFTSHAYDAMWLTLASAAWATHGGGSVTGALMRDGMTHVSDTSQAPLRLLASNWTELYTSLSGGVAVNVEGSSGPLDYNLDAGTPASPYEVWRVVDGGLTTVRLVSP